MSTLLILNGGGVAASPASPVDPAAAYPNATQNWTAANFPNWVAQRNAVLAGTATKDAAIDIAIDSTGIGYRAGPNGYDDCYPGSPVHLLATALSGNDDAWWGNHNLGSVGSAPFQLARYDRRIRMTSGAVTGTGNNVYGGGLLSMAGTLGTEIGFTPTAPYDRIRIYYVKGNNAGTYGSFDVIVNGVTVGTVDCSPGPAGYASVTYSLGALSTAEVVMKSTGTLTELPQGVETWNSSTRRMKVRNASSGAAVIASPFGAYGGPASFWAASASPALCLMGLLINDVVLGTTVAAYSTSLASWKTAAATAGVDLAFVVPNWVSHANAPSFSGYVDAMYAAAGSTIPVFSIPDVIGSPYAKALANGKMSDSLHRTDAADVQIMPVIASKLLSV